MFKQLFLIVSLFFNFSFFCSLKANTFSINEPIGHVNDFAGILSLEEKVSLEATLKAVNDKGGPQVAIVILNRLEDESIEDSARKIFDSWGIGHQGKDDGVLLLIAFRDQKMRIETGYGAEGVLTDSAAGVIIREEIAPYFKLGEYKRGIQNGVKAILAKFNKGLSQNMPRKSQVDFNNAKSIALILPILFLLSILLIPSWTLFLLATSLGELCIWFLLEAINMQNAIIPLGYFFTSLLLLIIGKGLFGKSVPMRLSKPGDNESLPGMERKNLYDSTYSSSTHLTSSNHWDSGNSKNGSFSGFGGGRGGGGGASGGW